MLVRLTPRHEGHFKKDFSAKWDAPTNAPSASGTARSAVGEVLAHYDRCLLLRP
jgi:hypothetical protein